MGITHLGLSVLDPQRSISFYAKYFGFDPATAQRYPDGTVIVRDGDGFDLALHAVDVVGEPPAFLHFGFRLPRPDDVRALQRRLEADRVTIVERDDEPEYTAFKCLDPDGHRVEVYWEPPGGSP
ncbi:VOC family protein [Actinoplanes aureus]|uniref:VOC family protein n=1 Tax=Actinoplanes aureus TaxID=2792083 RepID=A0A931CCD2_9ACTN|nr:VOC family protein [Actinoplanes aureus]MBG0564756.1 VOC family protein [Actinoplanes aureus]